MKNVLFIPPLIFRKIKVIFDIEEILCKQKMLNFCQLVIISVYKIDQADFYPKISQILDPSARNSVTQLILVCTLANI